MATAKNNRYSCLAALAAAGIHKRSARFAGAVMTKGESRTGNQRAAIENGILLSRTSALRGNKAASW